MKLLKLFIFILFVVSLTNAQDIYFCKSHTENGEPIDARNVWSIKPWGSYVYILFNNNGNEIPTKLNYMFVDRYIDGNYKPYDSKAINIKEGATWFAYNYKFKDPGKFKVYFIDQNKKQLASATVTIQLESDYKTSHNGTTSLYYDGAKITFCQRVIAGRTINEFRSLSLSKSDSVTVFVKNKNPLKTDVFRVDVWERPQNSINYGKFVESKRYGLDPSWDYAFFKYKFDEPGDYKIDVYNNNDILITSGYIKVTN